MTAGLNIRVRIWRIEEQTDDDYGGQWSLELFFIIRLMPAYRL